MFQLLGAPLPRPPRGLRPWTALETSNLAFKYAPARLSVRQSTRKTVELHNTFTGASVGVVLITSWTDALETPGCVATVAMSTQTSIHRTLVDIYASTTDKCKRPVTSVVLRVSMLRSATGGFHRRQG